MPAATLNMLLNITQPLMKQTGQLRWAMNNVAGAWGALPVWGRRAKGPGQKGVLTGLVA